MTSTQPDEQAKSQNPPENPPAYSASPPMGHGPGVQSGPAHAGFYPTPPVTAQVAFYPAAAPYGSALQGSVIIAPITRPVGPTPELVTCKSCHANIVTRVDRNPTLRTHLWALTCCLFGLWPCAVCMYCTNDCLLIDHYCPNCNSYVGRYHN